MSGEAQVLPCKAESAPYWFTRALFLRGLGIIYFIAFLSILIQGSALFGEHGILPMSLYQDRLVAAGYSFFRMPSVFFFMPAEAALQPLAALGVLLSLVVVFGYATSVALFLLWVMYLSIVNSGQIFLGYGWETLLLEAGFLAMFLAPAVRPKEFLSSNPPQALQIYLLRWLLFRLMFGAGMIKLHGDSCWWDLTCLEYHFETQPLPNPLSYFFHSLNPSLLHLGVFINHFVEVVVPWFLFCGRRMSKIAGILIIGFQATLILSGNLSWLNYLTIVIAICCFDDHSLALLVPRSWKFRMFEQKFQEISRPRLFLLRMYAIAVLLLSISPTINLFSKHQMMNASFDSLHLVNTYGAFGSIGRTRDEIILQGTSATVVDERTEWKEYEFPCKPGKVDRRPCVIAPYQLRIDWQIWFAAMSTFDSEPWFVHFVYQLLNGEKAPASLLEFNPFPESAPSFIRGQLYRYRLANPLSGQWWSREYLGPYFPPLSKNSPGLKNYLREMDLLPSESEAE